MTLVKFTSQQNFHLDPCFLGENCREIVPQSIEDLETGLERATQFPTGLRKFKRLQLTAEELLRLRLTFELFDQRHTPPTFFLRQRLD